MHRTSSAGRLKSLPEKVRETRRFPLGVIAAWNSAWCCIRNGAAEVFLEGDTTRHALLSREHHGPRAVLNALDRLAGSYEAQCATARQDLAIAEGQLRDYEARLGRPFAHDAYLRELTGLRDQLKAGLSGATPEPGADPLPPVQRSPNGSSAESRPQHRRRHRSVPQPAARPPPRSRSRHASAAGLWRNATRSPRPGRIFPHRRQSRLPSPCPRHRRSRQRPRALRPLPPLLRHGFTPLPPGPHRERVTPKKGNEQQMRMF